MAVNVLVFGQLIDITGDSTIVVDDVADTNQLVAKLNVKYPEITGVKYIIAVDKQVVSENTGITSG